MGGMQTPTSGAAGRLRNRDRWRRALTYRLAAKSRDLRDERCDRSHALPSACGRCGGFTACGGTLERAPVRTRALPPRVRVRVRRSAGAQHAGTHLNLPERSLARHCPGPSTA